VTRRSIALALAVLAALPVSARAAGDVGAFVMTVGRDTIGLERFTRTATGAEGTLLFIPTSLRFDYALEFAPMAVSSTWRTRCVPPRPRPTSRPRSARRSSGARTASSPT
jgi:hypothetical protein